MPLTDGDEKNSSNKNPCMIQVQLYGEHFESLRLGFCYYGGVVALESAPERFFAYKKWQSGESLSKTTKLILLDSLLQEVCISSGIDGSLTLEFARVECLSLSVTNLLYSGLKKAH